MRVPWGDDTLVERRLLVLAVVVCVVSAAVVTVTGHPTVGMALFALALVCVAIEYARGHG
jgi:hypothetical protein